MSSAGTFDRLAKRTARATGHHGTFAVALGIIILWAVTGPLFKFSDTWQLFTKAGRAKSP